LAITGLVEYLAQEMVREEEESIACMMGILDKKV